VHKLAKNLQQARSDFLGAVPGVSGVDFWRIPTVCVRLAQLVDYIQSLTLSVYWSNARSRRRGWSRARA